MGLISGGLDGALAAKIVKLQGIDVLGLTFVTPFVKPRVDKLAESIGVTIQPIDISQEYLGLIRNPCFGFGSNMNPCIDCHIFMLKKAGEIALRNKAGFLITGDVLGQRPMSQNKAALSKMEKESGLQGLILRPLSAKLLPITVPEQQGWVNRNRLFDFSGRSRKPQLQLAEGLGLSGFSQPAGGCLLTDPAFSRRLKDLLTYKPEFDLSDIELLKLGRHLRLSHKTKLVVGRHHQENQQLIKFINSDYIVLEPVDIPGPTVILDTEEFTGDLLEYSGSILAGYCDNGRQVTVAVESQKGKQMIRCAALESESLEALRI